MSSACGHRAHPRQNREAATLTPTPRPRTVRSPSLTAVAASLWPCPVTHSFTIVNYTAASPPRPTCNTASTVKGSTALELSL
jgi:hypothetical protein